MFTGDFFLEFSHFLFVTQLREDRFVGRVRVGGCVGVWVCGCVCVGVCVWVGG